MTPTNAHMQIWSRITSKRFGMIYAIFRQLYTKIKNLLKYNGLQKQSSLYYSILVANVNHMSFTNCD